MRKVIVCLIAFGMLAFVNAPASAGTVKLSGRHNAGEIKKACDKNGGTFANRGVDGYECIGTGGTIQCAPNGECKGSCSNCGKAAASGATGRNPTGGILTNAPAAKTQPLKQQQETTSPGRAPMQPLAQQKVTGSPKTAPVQPLTAQKTNGSSKSGSTQSISASPSSSRNGR